MKRFCISKVFILVKFQFFSWGPTFGNHFVMANANQSKGNRIEFYEIIEQQMNSSKD